MSTTEQRPADVPDIVSPAFKADPLAACAHLRAEQPVARVSVPSVAGGAYLILRYEDAIAVLRDERFVKDVRSARDPGDLRLPWVPGALKPLSHTILDSDGAEHRRLRSLVRDTFTPATSRSLSRACRRSRMSCWSASLRRGMPTWSPTTRCSCPSR